jgi:hypothetical protein
MSDGKLDLPGETKRTNYFTSQFLVEDDFKNEQAYHLEMRHLHNRALHIWGVVDGLVVKRDGPQSVSVGPGMAIDKNGKEIILSQSPSPAVTFDKNPPGPGALFVVLSYKDNDQDPKYIYTGTGLTDKNYTRTVESWKLKVVENAPDDGSAIKLALLKVDGTGLVGDPDNTVRRLAGSSVPRGSWLGTQDLCIGADGKVGIGTIAPGEKLQVNGGNLLVKGTDNFTASPHEGRVYLGDNNHYIKSVYGSGVRIGTANQVDAITLLQDGGKVGVGTISPGQRLEVAGALKLSSNPSVSNDMQAAYFWNQANVGPTIAGGQFEVRTGGDIPRLRIDPNGKVGIGVTNPAALLQAGPTPANVGGATFFNDAIAMFTCRESNVGNIPRKPALVLARDGVNTISYANFVRFDLGIYGGYQTQLDIGLNRDSLKSEGDNTPVVMSLRGDGKVGIGTTAPVEKLDVRSSLPDEVVNIKVANSDASSFINFYPGRSSDLNAAITWKTNTPLRFATADKLENNQVTNFVERVRITGDGNVGIGTNDPGASKLKISNSTSDFVDVRFSQAGSGQLEIVGWGSGWNINARTSGKHLYLNRDANDNSDVLIGHSGRELIVKGNSGNVGIGTATPQRRLQIGEVVNGLGFEPSDGSPNAGYIRFGDNTGWKLHFGRSQSGGSNVTGLNQIIMTLQDQGYVGIGTTDPKGTVGGAEARLVVMGSQGYGVMIGGSGNIGRQGYGGDGIKGTGNLWLDAQNTVYLKPGWKTAGSDLAEIFETAEQIAPGDVVVFDEQENAAKLCEREGDSCVIGIASTAPAGILGIGDESTPPIALCGRVPCNVDADIAPIRPGDLLTTSPTKGHAQKVLDVSRAAGAIIGKALGSLEKGKGKITVLVALA